MDSREHASEYDLWVRPRLLLLSRQMRLLSSLREPTCAPVMFDNQMSGEKEKDHISTCHLETVKPQKSSPSRKSPLSSSPCRYMYTHVHLFLPHHIPLLHLVGSLLGRSTSLPYSLDSLGQTNIVRLKLIPSPSNNEDGRKVQPIADLADLGHAPRGEVVGDDGSEGKSQLA